jgi:hypothetical protein
MDGFGGCGRKKNVRHAANLYFVPEIVGCRPVRVPVVASSAGRVQSAGQGNSSNCVVASGWGDE